MKVFSVGGSVRDKFLNKEPHDYDYVVVGAKPSEMEAMGYKQVGKDFPVYLHPDSGEEYALARTERKSGLKHTDFETVFDTSVTIEQDLARRDLTINSIAQDLETGEYIDPFNGIEDIHNKILRHTTEAFKEDPLRVLRLARFCAKFPDFIVANETKTLVRHMVENDELDHLPKDRIWIETKKALLSECPINYFQLLSRINALSYVCNNPKAIFYDEDWLDRVFVNTKDFDDDRKLLIRAAAFFSYYWLDFENEKDFRKHAASIKLPTDIITLAVFMGKFCDTLSFKFTPITTASAMVEMLDNMNIKGMIAKNQNFLEDMFLIATAWNPENSENYDKCKVIIEAYLDTKEFLSCMVKRYKWEYNTEPTGDDYKDMISKIKHMNVESAISRFYGGLVMTIDGFIMKRNKEYV